MAAADDALTLASIFVELRALRLAVDRLAAPASLSRADRLALARLLPVIGAVFGPEMFAVRELFLHESADLRLVMAGLEAKPVGKLFGRAAKAGQAVGGYVVTREADEGGVALWQVRQQVPGFQGMRNLATS